MEVQSLSEAFLARIEAKVEETRKHGGIPASRDEVQSLIASHRALSAALAQAEAERNRARCNAVDLLMRAEQAEAEREALRAVLAEARGWIARVSPTVLSPLARILDRAQETDEQWAARMVRYVNDRCAALPTPVPPSPPAGEEVPGNFPQGYPFRDDNPGPPYHVLPGHCRLCGFGPGVCDCAADAQGEGPEVDWHSVGRHADLLRGLLREAVLLVQDGLLTATTEPAAGDVGMWIERARAALDAGEVRP